jgi:hypothetical protein
MRFEFAQAHPNPQEPATTDGYPNVRVERVSRKDAVFFNPRPRGP